MTCSNKRIAIVGCNGDLKLALSLERIRLEHPELNIVILNKSDIETEAHRGVIIVDNERKVGSYSDCIKKIGPIEHFIPDSIGYSIAEHKTKPHHDKYVRRNNNKSKW